tara:strand:- start:742 stop:1188 length:447 start_codon:yes stop_codon:yes gene_type:complete
MIYREYLYGAYGSNLNLRQMKVRCPQAVPVGTVTVNGLRLVFRGVADVEFTADHSVPLGLWKITEQCEAALDIYEGYPRMYGKQTIGIKGLQAALGAKDVLIYTMNSTDIYPPCMSYLNAINEGYKDFDLDVEALQYAIKDSYARETI